MNKQMIGLAVSAFLCTASCAMGQLHSPAGRSLNAGMNVVPLTPSQKARIEQIGRLDQAAVAALNAGDYEQVEADARESIVVGQDSGLAQELLAVSLNAQGKTQEALQAYKVIADAGGDFPRNLVPYAILLLKSGQWKQAVAAYNKALLTLPYGEIVQANSHFSPNVPQPKELAITLHIAQGATYLGDGGWGSHSRNEEAMSEFDQALRLAPNLALTNYYYGFGWQKLDPKSHMRAANSSQAKAAFQKAASGTVDMKKAAEEALIGFK